MKKNCAPRAGHWRIGIMPDLDEPLICEIARAHFFMSVVVRRILRIDHDMAIVIRRERVVAPNVCLTDLMIWIVSASGQVGIVPEDLSNFEDAGRRAAVS